MTATTIPAIDELLAYCEAGVVLTTQQIGLLVDSAKRAEAQRLAADKIAQDCKVLETKLKLAIMTQMKTAHVGAIGGSDYTATLKTEDQPTVKDWPSFYKHIVANDAFDLLERRVSKTAVKLRWEDGKQVPGVEAFPVDKLSFTKLKG